jgi:hypothetical protein
VNYWHLTEVLGALLACGGLVYAASRWKRTPEVLRAFGYRGPKDLLKRTLTSPHWTVVAMIRLMLIGLLFKVLKLP